MAETFKRLASRAVGTSRVRVGGYTVPAATKAIVIGMSVANILTDACTATLEHHDGTNYTLIAKGVSLAEGQSLAPVGEMNKLILETGDGLFVTSGTASGLDVVVSIVEIT